MVKKITKKIMVAAVAVMVSVLSYSVAFAANIDQSVIMELVRKQTFTTVTNEEAVNYVDHLLNVSNYKPGNPFPYKNSQSSPSHFWIDDGTYSIERNGEARGCYLYSFYAERLIHGNVNKAQRIYMENTVDSVKDVLTVHGQAGEHIRIDNKHSITFLAADDNGFYYTEYAGDSIGTINLGYYAWDKFVSKWSEKWSGRAIWLYDKDYAENSETVEEFYNETGIEAENSVYEFDAKEKGCTVSEHFWVTGNSVTVVTKGYVKDYFSGNTKTNSSKSYIVRLIKVNDDNSESLIGSYRGYTDGVEGGIQFDVEPNNNYIVTIEPSNMGSWNKLKCHAKVYRD